MAASFPNAKKTFTAVENGVTKLVAALFNSPYDEVEALESFIGATGGGALAYTESLTNMFYNYRRGCAVEYKGAADLYVRSGEIMITDASGNRRLRRNTADTTVTWANIDTGAEANSTIYYVYAVADASATTFTIKVSTNATTPAVCTFYKLIGVFYNDSSGNIQEVGNLSRSFALSSWITKAVNTVYLATTDGLVTSYATSGANIILTDSANPPTVKRMAVDNSGQETGVCCPVKKGEYWKVTNGGAVSVYFIPLS
jgi:hypothetical protein